MAAAIVAVLEAEPARRAGPVASQWRSPDSAAANWPASSGVARSDIPVGRTLVAGRLLADRAGTTGGRWYRVACGPRASWMTHVITLRGLALRSVQNPWVILR